MRLCFLPGLLCACMLASAPAIAQVAGSAATASSAAEASVLPASEVAKALPATVFFRGLSAPIQARNSGGVRFADKRMMLVSLVDTSGYSTQVKEKYQAYLITESAIEIDGKRLPPGAYGCGFIADDTFVVQDVGAHDVLTAHSIRDADLRRPSPLQVVASADQVVASVDQGVASPGQGGSYRLYGGRSYVTFRLAAGQ